MDKYIVYMHTNRLNGKKYIGATHLPLSKRSNNGKGYSQQPRFFDDILLYGWDSFSHEILYDDLSRERAEEVERAMIRKYHTTDPKRGYNTECGGGIPTEETRRKISEAMRENPPVGSYPKREVYCPLNGGNLFESLTDCGRFFGISPRAVFADLNRDGGTARGFYYLDALIPKCFRYLNWR